MNAPGLYVHVPFCARACPYCDFDFEVGRRPNLDARIELYLRALDRELSSRAAGLSFDSVYLGGGTPSSIGPDGLRRVFAAVDKHARRDTAREVSVELNPEHVDANLLAALSDLGVNRVSLGVQSLASSGLAQLGRVHDEAQARAAMAMCQAKFATTVDLIVGWPGQREADLLATLETLVAAQVDHVSVYALTIEAGSAWPQLVKREQRKMPDPDAQAPLLELVERTLCAAGLVHYEVASYARPGCEAQHNQKYWTGADYLGVGPSAHSATQGPDAKGRTVVRRRGNPRGLDAWARGDAPSVEQMSGEAGAGEALWLALRLLGGVRLGELSSRYPQVDRAWVAARAPRSLSKGNLEWVGADRLRIAPGRWLWHDEVGEELV